MKRSKRLVAVVVIVVTLVVLAALLLPAVARFRGIAIRSSCQSNLHQFDIAIASYWNASKHYPSTLTDMSPNDIHSKLFMCPGDMDARFTRDLSNAWTTASYIYVAGLGPDCPDDMPLIICPPINHGGRGGNVLWGDHSTSWVPVRDFEKLIESLYANTNVSVLVGESLTKRSGGRYRSRL